jgi:hypothetical protein
MDRRLNGGGVPTFARFPRPGGQGGCQASHLTLLLAALSCLLPSPALACAACFGQSDSRLASGMNWGIFTLLGVVVLVLGGFAAFLVFLVRRSSETPPVAGADTTVNPSR